MTAGGSRERRDGCAAAARPTDARGAGAAGGCEVHAALCGNCLVLSWRAAGQGHCCSAWLCALRKGGARAAAAAALVCAQGCSIGELLGECGTDNTHCHQSPWCLCEVSVFCARWATHNAPAQLTTPRPAVMAPTTNSCSCSCSSSRSPEQQRLANSSRTQRRGRLRRPTCSCCSSLLLLLLAVALVLALAPGVDAAAQQQQQRHHGRRLLIRCAALDARAAVSCCGRSVLTPCCCHLLLATAAALQADAVRRRHMQELVPGPVSCLLRRAGLCPLHCAALVVEAPQRAATWHVLDTNQPPCTPTRTGC